MAAGQPLQMGGLDSSSLPDTAGELYQSARLPTFPRPCPECTQISLGKRRHAEVARMPWVTRMANSRPSIWNRLCCQNRQILPTGS